MTIAKRFNKGGAGRFRFSDLNAMLDELRYLREQVDKIRAKRPFIPPRMRYRALVTGRLAIPSTFFRWLYSWTRAAWNPNDRNYTVLSENSTVNGDPFALGATNDCEQLNTATYAGGVNISEPSYISCNLEPKPVATGTPIFIEVQHGVLSVDQVTGSRAVHGYSFVMPTIHDKTGNPTP